MKQQHVFNEFDQGPRYSSRGTREGPNYDEAKMDFGVSASEEEDENATPAAPFDLGQSLHFAPALWLTRGAALAGDSIDGVFSHKRDGEHGQSFWLHFRVPKLTQIRTADDERDEPKRNMRYLVKWQGYSHIHDTWEMFDSLRAFKGFKRVENYIKGPFAEQARRRSNPSTSREDIEALEIDKERQTEQLEGYKQVERIISQRTAPANADIDHEHRQSSPLFLRGSD